MGSFTPPSVNDVPPVLADGEPEQHPAAVRLYRYFRARPSGVNVYQYFPGSPMALAEGEISETDPYAIYDDDGVAISNGQEDVVTTFFGGTGPYEVSDAVAALLVAAGYTVT